MFSQSYTFRFFKYIADKAKESVAYRLVIWLGAFFASVYKKSFLKNYINTKLFFNKPWSVSALSQIADKLFSIPVFLTGKTANLFSQLSKGSVTAKTIECTFGRLGYTRVTALVFSAIFLCYSTWWNNIYALMAAVLLFVVLLYKYRDLKPSQLDFFMVLFGVSMVTGVIAAPDKGDAIRILLIAVTALIFMLVTAVSLDNENKVRSFLRIMSGAMAVTAVIAIIQRLMGIEVNPEFVDVATNAGMPGRVFSTMENPNNYAELLVLFMPFMVALLIDTEGIKNKLFPIGCIAITFVALAMTYSRSCYVAIALAMVIFVLIYDYRLIFPLLAIAIIAIPFLPETITNRIFTIGSLQDSSNSYRLYIWDACVRLITNYGVSGLGIGPSAFAAFYKPISHAAAIKAPHSHMLYMELILEYGILGFIGFFGFYIRTIRNGLRTLKHTTKKQRAYIAAGVGALGGMCFVSMAEYIWFYPRDMFAHFIVIGLLIAITRNIRRGSGVSE